MTVRSPAAFPGVFLHASATESVGNCVLARDGSTQDHPQTLPMVFHTASVWFLTPNGEFPVLAREKRSPNVSGLPVLEPFFLSLTSAEESVASTPLVPHFAILTARDVGGAPAG